VMFLEGYLFDKPKGKEAFYKAARLTRQHGGRAGIAISDPFCVERHREDFLDLIENQLDFVIGNEAEIRALYRNDDLETDLKAVSEICSLVVCTRSGDGVTIMREGHRTDVGVEKIVPMDATGAGDQFAAGFLYGLVLGHDMTTCGKLGSIAAREVISHYGARPEADIRELFRNHGLA